MGTSQNEEFKWPWQYHFPPFFTLQPNEETRKKQLDAWCHLVVSYFQHKKQTSMSISTLYDQSFPLFHNKQINRWANEAFIAIILDNLKRRGNLEWTDKSHKHARISWRTSSEWADLIYKWARNTGRASSVCTIYEITDGSETENEDFHELDESVILDALSILQKRGKAEIMDGGVKFF